MAYKINKTNPFAENATINISEFTSNGPLHPLSPILDDTAIAANSSLILYGKAHPNYGERLSENILNILENFSGSTEPSFATEGQQWSCRIDFILTDTEWYEWDPVGKTWNVAVVTTGTPSDFVHGELFFDNSSKQLTRVVNTANNALSPSTIKIKHTTTGAFSNPNSVGFLPEVVTMEYRNGEWRGICNITVSKIEPTSADEGRVWYDTTANRLKIYVDDDFIELNDNFLDLSGGTMSGDIDMATNSIVNLGTPSTNFDATTKKYVDDLVLASSVASSNVNDLSNVDDGTAPSTATPFLKYNTTSSKYEVKALQLADLQDVSVSATEINYLSGLTSNVKSAVDTLTINLGNQEQAFMVAEGTTFVAVPSNTITVVDGSFTTIYDPDSIFDATTGEFDLDDFPAIGGNAVVEISVMVKWETDATAGSWRKVGLSVSPSALTSYEDLREIITGQETTNSINTGPVRIDGTSTIAINVEHSASSAQDLTFFSIGIKILDKSA